MKKLRRVFLISICLLLMSSVSFAHSGRTDSNGGHKDKNNVSGLGSYHYHHGYEAHLHPNGVCPYTAPVEKSTSTNTQSNTSSKNNSTTQVNTVQSQTKTSTANTTYNTLELPKYNIHINDIEYINKYEQYPVYILNNTAYLPLTWEIKNLIGVDAIKNVDNSYSIDNKKGTYTIETLSPIDKLYNHSSINTSNIDCSLKINGSSYKNSELNCGVLVINDVVYIPLSWDIAVEKLNLEIKLSKDEGLEITSTN